jgi:hypothetical protein
LRKGDYRVEIQFEGKERELMPGREFHGHEERRRRRRKSESSSS